jgi:hypothetical protein
VADDGRRAMRNAYVVGPFATSFECARDLSTSRRGANEEVERAEGGRRVVDLRCRRPTRRGQDAARIGRTRARRALARPGARVRFESRWP